MASRFPIVDAHQHFWDPRANYHPWLCDPEPIAFRYGDYSALRRPYLPADYLADAGAHEVVKTVYVETEWDPHDPLGETAWVERLRRETGLPTVMVAQAWLDRDDAAAVLERQAAFPFVRGIRHKPRRGAMRDARWRAGDARLARHRLGFDLQAPWTELGVPGARWSAVLNREVVLSAIEVFGAARAMFASNFPVDGLCASFDEIYSGFREIVASFSATEQRALFHDNALRHYAMEEPAP